MLYHPLLERPVSNDLDFSKNMMIGDNALHKKSTYLRMAAINAICAQDWALRAESLTLQHGHVLSSMDR